MITKKERKKFIKRVISDGKVPLNDFLTGQEWRGIEDYMSSHCDKKSKKLIKKVTKKYLKS